MNKVFLLAILIASLASCRATKKIGTAIAKKDTVQVVSTSIAKTDSVVFINNVLQQIAINKINFTSFSGKINIDYRGGVGTNNLLISTPKEIWLLSSITLV